MAPDLCEGRVPGWLRRLDGVGRERPVAEAVEHEELPDQSLRGAKCAILDGFDGLFGGISFLSYSKAEALHTASRSRQKKKQQQAQVAQVLGDLSNARTAIEKGARNGTRSVRHRLALEVGHHRVVGIRKRAPAGQGNDLHHLCPMLLGGKMNLAGSDKWPRKHAKPSVLIREEVPEISATDCVQQYNASS